MAGGGRPGGARRASRSIRQPKPGARRRAAANRGGTPARSRGGKRALRPRQRRTRGLGGTLGLTLVGAVVPGTGYLFAGRKAAGWIVLAGWAATFGGVVWLATRDRRRLFDLVLDPTMLTYAAVAIGCLLAVWVLVVWTSYRLIRPRERPRWHTVLGNIAVVVACVVVALPAVRAAQYTLATADFMGDTFAGNETATTPVDVSERDPFGSRDRVNVLLLGGDANEHRDGVRTDSLILVSIDTESGEATTFSLPRNMERAQFPAGSPLAELYPDGFTNGVAGDANYMLNAVYQNVPRLHPGVLGGSSNEGADAIKQAVSGTLGVPVEYYVKVDLAGFRRLVDAMGGVTVNINRPVAIGGNTDRGIPPDDYLDPGPDQHLNGFEALWFARGRWGSDDYERMERQRCVIDAIVQEADPTRLVLRYLDLLEAGKRIVQTDIPQPLVSAFVDLALRTKESRVQSVVFQRSEQFNSGDPDFGYVRAQVQLALSERPERGNSQRANERGTPGPSGEGTATPNGSVTDVAEELEAPQDAADACAYQPVAAAAE